MREKIGVKLIEKVVLADDFVEKQVIFGQKFA